MAALAQSLPRDYWGGKHSFTAKDGRGKIGLNIEVNVTSDPARFQPKADWLNEMSTDDTGPHSAVTSVNKGHLNMMDMGPSHESIG